MVRITELFNTSKSIQNLRRLIQIVFVILCIWIGIEFHFFVKYISSNGAEGITYRPPGVDGFLPIASLMNLLYFVKTGSIHPVHPAGFFIFVSILLMSVAFGKSFCSWLCPIGTLSEYLTKLGRVIFKKKFSLPKFLDYPLRSIKYLLLGFFAFAIFTMSAFQLKAFLDGDYNIVADIKMYEFFADISGFAFWTLTLLILLSIVIQNFWCRYLCPYGALLGIAGLLSPNKIKRREETCINCSKCFKICPSVIHVDKVKTVISDECTSCMQCVDICPVENTLTIQPVFQKRKSIHKKYVMIAVIVIFMGATLFAMLTNHWQNNVSMEKYFELYPNRNEFLHH